MTRVTHFDPTLTRSPLRRGLPAATACYRCPDPDRWRRDLLDFCVTFAVAFTGILTLFG